MSAKSIIKPGIKSGQFCSIMFLLLLCQSCKSSPSPTPVHAAARFSSTVVPEGPHPVPSIRFYAINVHQSVRFDIFRFGADIWQKQSVLVKPGDRIGASPKDMNEFDTGWMLVDVREDPAGNIENKILILVRDNGSIISRQISSDRTNPEYRKLLLDIPPAAPCKPTITIQ